MDTSSLKSREPSAHRCSMQPCVTWHGLPSKLSSIVNLMPSETILLSASKSMQLTL